jgi:hypothetical protein
MFEAAEPAGLTRLPVCGVTTLYCPSSEAPSEAAKIPECFGRCQRIDQDRADSLLGSIKNTLRTVSCLLASGAIIPYSRAISPFVGNDRNGISTPVVR